MPLGPIKGVEGAVSIGGRVACQLESWELVGNEISAAPYNVNDFRIGRSGPFSVSLVFGSRTWTWQEANLDYYDDETIHLTLLGERESR